MHLRRLPPPHPPRKLPTPSAPTTMPKKKPIPHRASDHHQRARKLTPQIPPPKMAPAAARPITINISASARNPIPRATKIPVSSQPHRPTAKIRASSSTHYDVTSLLRLHL